MTKMDSLGLTPFDAAQYLTDEDSFAEFLNASIEIGDPAVLLNALSTVVRVRTVTQLQTMLASAERALTRSSPGAKRSKGSGKG